MFTKQRSIALGSSNENSTFTTFAIVFAAASTPLPTAWGSISLVLLLVAYFAQAFKSSTWLNISNSPLSWASLGIMGALAIGMLYGNTPFSQAFEFWTKYLKLLVVPLIIGLAPNERTRHLAINAALLAVMASIVVSYGRYFGLVAPFPDPNQSNIGFQNRITFGLYTSIASYIFAYRALKHKHKSTRLAYAFLFIITSFNTLAINNGRTGYVIFLGLAILFLYRNARPTWRLASIGLTAFAIIATLLVSPASRDRLERTLSNAEALHKNDANNQSSIVIRWQFLINSLNIIRTAPILGHGTGSFQSEYAKRIVGSNQVGSSNPHNDYLLIAAQLGLFGLIFEFILIGIIYNEASKASGDAKEFAYALLTAFILYSALNSTLLNAGEGRFFLILLAIILSTNTKRATHPDAEEQFSRK
ncbi:MAG: O-antigen ligase family protein [Pseudomonadota bacterium]